MRRGFSIFLILFFGLGPLSALIDGSEDASLPPCCRRHGAHHCAMYARIMAMRAGLRARSEAGLFRTSNLPALSRTRIFDADAGLCADGRAGQIPH